MMIATLALSLARLRKTFPGTTALAGVSLEIAPGEVHALLGQNGSGKSTLIKVLAGFHRPDPGSTAAVLGKPFTLGERNAAHAAGLRFVHQDLGLVGAFNAVENMALGVGYATSRGARIRWHEQQRRTIDAIEALGYDIDVNRPVDELSISNRAAVAIARALQHSDDVPLLVLDEPTAAMPLPEIESFLRVVRRVASRGTAVLYVSHHLGEVFDIADRITVLRDGLVVGSSPADQIDQRAVVELMTGRTAVCAGRRTSAPDVNGVVLAARNLAGGALECLDVGVRTGEIVGVAGITGSGRDEVCDLLFGTRKRAGTVDVNGVELPSGRPDLAIAAHVGLVPSNRHRDGVILPLSVRENLTLPDLSAFWRRMLINRRAERAESRHWIERLHVKTVSEESPLESLSGGNQQKVVIGKWLRLQPDVLLLDEPTQGVDVGATAEIHHLIRASADAGMGVLVCSSDEEELADLCDRVLVMRSGRCAEELCGPGLAAAHIIAAILGINDRAATDKLARKLVE
jgi:ribose transport system ATP-binding protein